MPSFLLLFSEQVELKLPKQPSIPVELAVNISFHDLCCSSATIASASAMFFFVKDADCSLFFRFLIYNLFWCLNTFFGCLFLGFLSWNLFWCLNKFFVTLGFFDVKSKLPLNLDVTSEFNWLSTQTNNQLCNQNWFSVLCFFKVLE